MKSEEECRQIDSIQIKPKHDIKSNSGNMLFDKKITYKAEQRKNSITVKDEVGGIRNFSLDDKWFKENFTVVKE